MSETSTVSHNGHDFTFPASPDDWPFEAVEAMEQGKALTFVRVMLGDQARDYLRTNPTAGDGGELMRKILDTTGAQSAGESGASTD